MSQAEQKKSIDERIEAAHIIDADFHLAIKIKRLKDYIDNRQIRRKIEQFGPPNDVTGITTAYSTPLERNETSQGQALNRDEVQDYMQEMSLDEVVVTPSTMEGFQGGKYPTVKNAIVRAYNDFVLDRIIDIDRGIYASLAIPAWDPEATLEELDRLGSEDGFVAAQYWFMESTLLGDPGYDDVLEKIASLDFPLALHPGVTETRFTLSSDSMNTFTEWQVIEATRYATANVLNMIMTGVFEKYPDLEVIVQEGGQSWIPHLAHFGDEVYQYSEEDIMLGKRMMERDQNYLSRMPSEYLFDHFYVSTQPIALPQRTDMVDAMLKLCRANDMFVFSTDWPHISIDTPKWVFEQSGIDDDMRTTILSENAREVFRLPK